MARLFIESDHHQISHIPSNIVRMRIVTEVLVEYTMHGVIVEYTMQYMSAIWSIHVSAIAIEQCIRSGSN